MQYLAGFFDGEGCISLGRRSDKDQIFLSIRVTNTKLSPLKLFLKEFGGKIFRRNPKTSRSKYSYFWKCYHPQQERFITKVLIPYSIIKKEQGIIALDFLKLRGTRFSKNLTKSQKELRRVLHLRMSRLNKKGV
jgi:hypothetical protein